MAIGEKQINVIVSSAEEGNGSSLANIKDSEGLTPLHYAAAKGSIKAIVSLVKAGAKLEARDNDKRTPLHHAAMNGQIEAINVLLAEGAIFTARDGQMQGALDYPVMKKWLAEGSIFLTNANAVDGTPFLVWLETKCDTVYESEQQLTQIIKPTKARSKNFANWSLKIKFPDSGLGELEKDHSFDTKAPILGPMKKERASYLSHKEQKMEQKIEKVTQEKSMADYGRYHDNPLEIETTCTANYMRTLKGLQSAMLEFQTLLWTSDLSAKEQGKIYAFVNAGLEHALGFKSSRIKTPEAIIMPHDLSETFIAVLDAAKPFRGVVPMPRNYVSFREPEDIIAKFRYNAILDEIEITKNLPNNARNSNSIHYLAKPEIPDDGLELEEDCYSEEARLREQDAKSERAEAIAKSEIEGASLQDTLRKHQSALDAITPPPSRHNDKRLTVTGVTPAYFKRSSLKERSSDVARSAPQLNGFTSVPTIN